MNSAVELALLLAAFSSVGQLPESLEATHPFTVNLFDKNIPTTWSIEPGKQANIKWVAKLGPYTLGRPVVAGGKIFVGTDYGSPRNAMIPNAGKGVLMCFRESDGQFLWQAVHEPTVSQFDSFPPRYGQFGAPAVEGNRLYYVSSAFDMICADTATGKPIWHLDLKRELGVGPKPPASCTPLSIGDMLILCTGNAVNWGNFRVDDPRAPSLIAIDRRSGKLIWKDNSPTKVVADLQERGEVSDEALLALKDKGLDVLQGQWSSPVFANLRPQAQVIFAGGDGWVRGFEATKGTLLWKFDCNPKSSKHMLGARGTRNCFVGTPVVYENKLYIAVGQNAEWGEGVGHLWCIDITKAGDISPVNDIWDPKHPANTNSGLVWHFGGNVDPKPKDAGVQGFVFGRSVSTCAVHDGLVYAAELGGWLHCLDAGTGQKYWEHDLKEAIIGSPYWVDGKIYLGAEDGKVFIFAHSKQKKLLSTIEMDEPIWSTPVVANGALFIATRTHLYAIEQPKN